MCSIFVRRQVANVNAAQRKRRKERALFAFAAAAASTPSMIASMHI
jgi:hypothetical protein